MAAQPQRLALGLAHHVQQAAQRLQGELADRARACVHLQRKRRDLDRGGAAGAGKRRRSSRLLEQHGVGSVEQFGQRRRGRSRRRDRGPASAWRC